MKKILGQFADDMDMYLWGNENTINAAISIIKFFEKNSGFRINYDKTALYRIGSLKEADASKFTVSIQWAKNDPEILGVIVAKAPQ